MFKELKSSIKQSVRNLLIYSLHDEYQSLLNRTNDLENHLHFVADQQAVFWKIGSRISSFPKAEGCLKELQDVNFYILKRLKEICDSLGIQFWLHGGTLLGAVRHGGFIPWDDDIDVGIRRADFEKLSAYLEEDGELELKNFYFVPGICSRQPRVVFRGTYQPFFVDLFVYDDISTDNPTEAWNTFCAEKEAQVRELEALRIYNNPHCLIDDEADRARVDAVYARHNWKNNQTDLNAIIFNMDEGTNLIQPKTAENDSFVRCFFKDFIFPLKPLQFCGVDFFVPNHYEEYLIAQYGDYMLLPRELERSQHLVSSSKEMLLLVHNTWCEKIRSNGIGYTAGAFDLFHIGHLNLLRRAKERCSHLIVGVTTDALVEQTKGHKPAIPLAERMEIVKSCKYVNEVVIQDDLDKVLAWQKYHFNVLFSGDDWKGNPRWVEYERRLNELCWGGVFIYLPYTRTSSSSKINAFLEKENLHE